MKHGSQTRAPDCIAAAAALDGRRIASLSLEEVATAEDAASQRRFRRPAEPLSSPAV
jgi:hypothetical protein